MKICRKIHTTRSLLWVSAACVALSACGGSNGSPPSSQVPAPPVSQPPAPPPVSTSPALVYLTDDFDTEHEAVWITVQRITAFNGSTETLLLDHRAAPVTVNLSTLKRSGLLIGKAGIPSDTTEIRVYVDAQAKTQGLGGVATTVPLVREAGGYVRVPLSGWASTSGTLALDFDLPRFQLVGGSLQPATRIAGSDDQDKWTGRSGELKGIVRDISATSITIESDYGERFTIALGDITSYRSKSGTGWRPVIGQRAEIDVLIGGTGSQPTYQALVVDSEDLFDSSNDGDAPEVDGTIIGITGNSIRLAVLDGEDIAFAGQIDIDMTGAIFSRGAASLLAIGQRLELHLVAKPGGGWRALVAQIKGARKNDDLPDSITSKPIGSYDDENEDDRNEAGKGYAEAKGQFVSRNGSQVTLRLYKAERAGSLRAGDTVTFDLTRTVFTDGALGCLVSGSALELKGYLSTTGQFTPEFAELDGPCLGLGAGDGTAPIGAIMEAEGRILSVGNGSFEMQVFKVDDWFGAIPTQLTVQFDVNTYFEDVTAGQLRANMLVDVKGTVNGQVMTARKVELD